MIQQVIIERIRRRHPDRREAEIRAEMNLIKKEFCRETRINEGEHDGFSLDGSSVMYDFGSEVVNVKQVDLDGVQIQQLTGVYKIELTT